MTTRATSWLDLQSECWGLGLGDPPIAISAASGDGMSELHGAIREHALVSDYAEQGTNSYNRCLKKHTPWVQLLRVTSGTISSAIFFFKFKAIEALSQRVPGHVKFEFLAIHSLLFTRASNLAMLINQKKIGGNSDEIISASKAKLRDQPKAPTLIRSPPAEVSKSSYVGVTSIQGTRDKMEDFHVSLPNFGAYA